MSTLYDRVAAKRGGKAALAAARLRREMLASLHEAFQASGLNTQSEIARRLGVRRSAVNQVFRGDGNLRINTLAEYLYTLGFELDVMLVPAGEPRRAELEGRPSRAAFPLWTSPAYMTLVDPSGAGDSLGGMVFRISSGALPEIPQTIEAGRRTFYGFQPPFDFAGMSTSLVVLVVPSHESSQRRATRSIPESTSGQMAIEPPGKTNAS